MITWKTEDFLQGKDYWIKKFEEALIIVRKTRKESDWQIAGIAYQVARKKGATNDDTEAKLVSVFEDEFKKCRDNESMIAHFLELSHKLDLTEETKKVLREVTNAGMRY